MAAAAGYVNFTENPLEWLRHLLFPAFSIGFIQAAVLTRMIRMAMLEELVEEYVMVARANR